jgi:CRISPR/Cas system CSM-associated protein Csm2 small subunit
MKNTRQIGNYELTNDQFSGKEKVGGSLDLRSLTSIPEGFNPTVGGNLYLDSLTSIPEGFNPTVGGNLYLDSLTSIPEGFNPTVGGSLDLDSLTSIPEGFNPTVGGNLNLDSLTSIPEGFNPTVGGSLDLRSLTSKYTKIIENTPITWQNGKFIKVDGIFTEVVSKRGNVYRVKKLNNPKVFYLITDGEKFSHGETLKEAKSDLIYKISNKSKDDYKNLKLSDFLSFEESIVCYRVITGACSFGTKDFISNRLNDKKKKKKYSINEIIKLTENEYGNKMFKNFFKK